MGWFEAMAMIHKIKSPEARGFIIGKLVENVKNSIFF